MELILFGIVVLQFAFLVYYDFQTRKERELLQLKLMSANLEEYKFATEETPEDQIIEEDDPYIPLDSAGIEQVIRSKESK
jgi:hypothetical protein